jgi:hypothetical protein
MIAGGNLLPGRLCLWRAREYSPFARGQVLVRRSVMTAVVVPCRKPRSVSWQGIRVFVSLMCICTRKKKIQERTVDGSNE